MEISKELFEKVMGIKLGNEHNTGQELMFMKTVVYYTDISKKYKLGDIIDNLNIHELAHKCKEWAYKQGYSIVDGIDTIGNKICYIMKCTGFAVDYYYEQTINYVDVFQACQWILENK